ncbi:hypothetical protein ElyMa_004209800 [Elysia marginata]|uniref:Uncharacterized protein n=1 Tax=Elysia marginata TaxID=1093978 RepID=A0AAV4GP67_9GAST|nr:hypothetical protein ElyMa_004209800 [Elysia marginata]
MPLSGSISVTVRDESDQSHGTKEFHLCHARTSFVLLARVSSSKSRSTFRFYVNRARASHVLGNFATVKFRTSAVKARKNLLLYSQREASPMPAQVGVLSKEIEQSMCLSP